MYTCSLFLPTSTYTYQRPKPELGAGVGVEGEKGGGAFKRTPSPAASVPSERRLETFFFAQVYHPTGCKGACPWRNVKSNLEKSRHLPRKGEGELLRVRTRPFPEAGFSNLWEL